MSLDIQAVTVYRHLPGLRKAHERTYKMPATARRRAERISLRVTSQEKELLARAAALETAGDLTRFVASAAMRAARSTIEEYGVSCVTDHTRKRFYDLLVNPPAPNEALIKLMASDEPEGFDVER
jgi:uncharacterized protein (DUF1778 family)